MNRPLTVIEALNPWKPFDFREIARYRDMLYFRIVNGYRAEHRQTVLSSLWVVGDPLLKVLFLTIVFGLFAKVKTGPVPYVAFVAAAILPWQFLSMSLTASINSLANEVGLLQKIYFPRVFIPLVPCLIQLPNFLVQLVLTLAVLAWKGFYPSWEIVFLPLILALMILFSTGIGLLLSTYVIQFKDLRKIWAALIQFLIYAAPVAYPVTAVPEKWRFLYLCNPLAAWVEAFRDALLGRPLPWGPLGVSAAACAATLYLGAVLFRRREVNIVDAV